ncbi:DinB family protein [Thalassobacillus sp. CUG 92003]|uniref:DinB family protein n=1 Tax=Thalassobacillus sp. CUG 92003 TaxID=2736641 RepID=UPI0015E6C4A3|nr:DinB family protein [Thalassobacillus sp. CUG 92003]
MDVLKAQYDLVKYTREQLFRFCEGIDEQDYTKEIAGFGWGSIRNLHGHVAECYQSWLGRFGLKDASLPRDSSHIVHVKEMRALFTEVDALVDRFFAAYDGAYQTEISGTVSWQEAEESLSVLWLMTHTITHEFHHKGQIVSMARQLGYEPIDTDLLTPSDLNQLF